MNDQAIQQVAAALDENRALELEIRVLLLLAERELDEELAA